MSDRREDGESWEFQHGDTVKQNEEMQDYAPGGVPMRRREYYIKRLLRDENTGERFYQVRTEHDDTHLYAAGAIEGAYEVVERLKATGKADES